MKKFVFYLPQFHEIQENNEWWGDGFTEWTNVKKAIPLYKGHVQPKHPLNNNYYNLLDQKTIKWQTHLMKKYHVDGLIYYHYYFCGRMLLEKPAENLLAWTEIEQPFFFCWANHSWNRSWSGTKELLLEQTYGNEKDWNKHFEYLLPFFKDCRYEKIDNKPIFMIFNSEIPRKNNMFDFFEKKCIENGFSGLYLIETFMGSNNWPYDFEKFQSNLANQTQKTFLREYIVSGNIFKQKKCYYPYRTYRKILKVWNNLIHKKHVEKYSGNIFYNIIRTQEPKLSNIIHGLFFEWDNTPRHGYRGSVVSPPSKKNFMKTMNYLCDDDYVFINAWNEWAEGMVLEPSEENGYKYLEWIKEWSENNVPIHKKEIKKKKTRK